MRIAALIVAAGRGTRAGGRVPKQWQTLLDRRVIDWTLSAFKTHPQISQICAVLHPDDEDLLDDPTVLVAHGGATRDQSVLAGLKALASQAPDAVLIHDAARATISADIIDGVIEALKHNMGAAPAIPVTDALWIGRDGKVVGTQDRTHLFRAQTPQGFWFKEILDAHLNNTHPAADDVEVARRAQINVVITPGADTNIKITTPEDFERAEQILRTRK